MLQGNSNRLTCSEVKHVSGPCGSNTSHCWAVEWLDSLYVSEVWQMVISFQWCGDHMIYTVLLLQPHISSKQIAATPRRMTRLYVYQSLGSEQCALCRPYWPHIYTDYPVSSSLSAGDSPPALNQEQLSHLHSAVLPDGTCLLFSAKWQSKRETPTHVTYQVENAFPIPDVRCHISFRKPELYKKNVLK